MSAFAPTAVKLYIDILDILWQISSLAERVFCDRFGERLSAGQPCWSNLWSDFRYLLPILSQSVEQPFRSLKEIAWNTEDIQNKMRQIIKRCGHTKKTDVGEWLSLLPPQNTNANANANTNTNTITNKKGMEARRKKTDVGEWLGLPS